MSFNHCHSFNQVSATSLFGQIRFCHSSSQMFWPGFGQLHANPAVCLMSLVLLTYLEFFRHYAFCRDWGMNLVSDFQAKL